MASKMTKQGSLDNEVTYEFMCDTIADMNAIENRYRVLGSIAAVLEGESGGFEMYMANSNQEWVPVAAGDSGGSSGGSFVETDPTVPAWAKAATKPTYTAAEVGALPANTVIPSIDGLASEEYVTNALATAIGNLHSIDAAVVNVLPEQDISTSTIYFLAKTGANGDSYDEFMYINNAWEKIGDTSLDLSGYLRTSDLAAWAKAAEKPTYTAQEVGALPASTVIPTVPANVSAFNNDAGYLTQHQDISNLATKAEIPSITGLATEEYVDSAIEAINIPEVPTNVSAFTNDAGYLTQHQDISNLATKAELPSITGLATEQYVDDAVAAITIPTVPTNVSAFTNDAGYLTGHQDISNLATKAELPDVSNFITANDIPSDISAFNNDVGYLTEHQTIDLSNYVQKTDYATSDTAGLVKVSSNLGVIFNSDNILSIQQATDSQIKTGTTGLYPIAPARAHIAAFYGLAKAAGDTTQAASENAVGTYTDEAKAAIQTMLGVPGDIQVNGTSIVSNGVANLPVVTTDGSVTLGLVKPQIGLGTAVASNGGLAIVKAEESNIKAGSDGYRPIVPQRQHMAVFYGLAKAAGDTTQAVSENAVGTYTADAKTAIQTMLGVSSSADVAALTNRVAELESEVTSLRNALNLLNVPENAVRAADGTPVTDEALNYVEFDEPTT